MKRYQIEICFLRDKPTKWYTFYAAKSKRTERAARKEWWYWVNYPWEDNQPIVFRIWDRKLQKEVEL